MVLRKFTRFDPGKEPIGKLAQIVTYGMLINLFFVALELFTAFYSGMPEHMIHFQYLFVGIGEHKELVPWMWASMTLAVVAVLMLLSPKVRGDYKLLTIACVLVFVSIWIDKGMGMVVGGFSPSTLGTITDYLPTVPEVLVSLAIYAVGFLMITVFYKIALSVRDEVA